MKTGSRRRGMNIAVNIVEPRLAGIKVTEDEITAFLVDGRVVSVPMAWSWRLSDATSEQRQRFEIIGDGIGIHWPDIDEDISVEGMLFGLPARRPAKIQTLRNVSHALISIAGHQDFVTSANQRLKRRILSEVQDA